VIAKRNQEVAPLRTLRADVPATLDAAVLHCLAVSPSDRPTAPALAGLLSGMAMGGPEAPTRPGRPRLERTLVLADAPTRVRTATRPAPTWRARPAPIRRRRAAAAAAAVAALPAVAAAIALGSGGSHPARPHAPTAPTGPTPLQHAQNLARWIEQHRG
jgi:hypothetical protein